MGSTEMATANYTTGTWLGLVRSRTAVFLGPGTPPALVQSIWDLLEGAPEVHEVLHAVTSSFGVSLAQIPSFGIVDSRDALRVFLRGDMDLTVQLPAGPVELNGRDVTTWTERRLDLPEWYRLTVAGDTQAGQVLPLTEGVVLLQSLTVGLTAALPGEPAAPAVVNLQAQAAAVAPEAAPAPELVPGSELVPDTGVDRGPAVKPGILVGPGAEPAPATDTDEEADLAPAHLPAADSVVPEREAGPDAEPAPERNSAAGPAQEPEANSARSGSGNNELEVSAETVMGLLDDDSHYAGESPEPGREAEPGPAADTGHPTDSEPASHADQAPAHELTGTYDHLWEKTVVRRIEDAAVRDDPDEAAASSSPQVDTPAADAEAGTSGLPVAAQHAPDVINPAPPAPAPPAPVPATIPATGLGSGLIDSVPWRTAAGNAPAAQVPSSFLPPVQAPVQAPAPDTAADPAGFDGDHDGHTIMKSDLAGIAAHPAAVAEPDAGAGPLVLARVCDRGHSNPPTHAQCAACSLPLPSDAVQVARPRLGRMRVSSGELVDLDQSLVIGRQPSVSRVQGGVMPRLVQVSSPSGDISRSHVEVRLEGWHVMLCDLKATNGTVLVREGQQPRRLAQNEMAILLDGDIAELGDDISLRFEEIL
ncbi:FHA domain-containing protein [Pseudarthrobacter sulfonivorans]|uniref:FHA domain-containing protein n=1 Tax=Pseudarthrobacter sulfonivorans TaxID=121292 RepID=UPI002864257C|nr:FHA domain-containing protein [Pseudarthrobacter sulfonivorans]MDR6416171.1 hypothetical protein [Pseudarthrobacter sulfonivorans]